MFLFLLTLISLWLEDKEEKPNFMKHSKAPLNGFAGEISSDTILWVS